MKATELHKALESSITSCQPSEYWKSHMVRQIVKEEGMTKRTKLSTGVILVAVFMLISAVALAVGILVNEYYAKVAEMDASGALGRWNLEDKITFVKTMRECNFEMDPELYQILMDEGNTKEERENAADRIVDDTYGELIRQQQGYYISKPEDSIGVAPDPVIVFQERYFAEHPEPIDDTPEGRKALLAYTDALGYYLRDVYNPLYMQERDGQGGPPEKTEVTEETAIEALRSLMTEVLGWDPEEVSRMTPEVQWDAEYRMWTVSGEVSAASMERMTDRRKGMEPSLEGTLVEKTVTGYRATLLVDEKGNQSFDTLDKEEFRNMCLNDVTPEINTDAQEALALAERAIREKYHVTETEMNALFCDLRPVGTVEDGGLLVRMQFHTHYQLNQEMKYGAVINLGTGKVEAVYTYDSGQWPAALQILKYGAECEAKYGWYIHWNPESKAELIRRLRETGICPDHSFWTLAQPDEARMDAFIAEAFGVPGYPSAVNEARMIHVLLGNEENRDQETQSLLQYLLEKYHIHSEVTAEEMKQGGSEIDRETAGQIVKDAVCEAWNMPKDAMEKWECTTQLVQAPATPQHASLVCYRVFLTRPDSEVGLDTFGGRDNFNYRILLNGTVMDSTMVSEWYSPAEDVKRWSKEP